jgi:mRNA interferase MazF
MVIKRGEIWWAQLPSPEGSGPGYRRPVVVVQSDAFNSSRIQTVIAAVVTSNLQREHAPGNILLTRKQSRLPRKSVVNVSQLITLDRSYLAERVTKLSPKLLSVLEEGLRLVLSL